MAWRDGELLIVKGSKRTRAHPAHAIDELLRNGVVGRPWLIVFAALAVIDQPGGEHIGIAVIQVVKQLADILANGDFEFHAQVVGKLLRQFVIEPGNFAVNVVVGEWRADGTDTQLPPRLDRGDTVFGFAEPGD
ncbi:hypothetical protein D3C72_1242550 [compost metagenome]